MGRGDGHGRDHGTVHGQGRMRLTRSGILWSSDRRGVGHFDSTRLESSQLKSQVKSRRRVLGRGKHGVWSVGSALLWKSGFPPGSR